MFKALRVNISIWGILNGVMHSLIELILHPRWVVDDEGCLGLRIRPGINFIYHKWPDPVITYEKLREIEKREFGESVKSNN